MGYLFNYTTMMSGNVAITVRESDGTEHRMMRPVYGVQAFVKNPKILQNPIPHWNLLEETGISYDKQYDSLAPTKHGLVVVDAKEQRILNYLDLNFDCFYGSTLRVQAREEICLKLGLQTYGQASQQSLSEWVEAFSSENEYCCPPRFKTFFDQGKVIGCEVDGEPYSIKGMGFENIVQLIKETGDIEFEVDFTPFQIQFYSAYNPQEAKRMHEDIVDSGFKISATEEKLWEEWIEDHK